MITNASRGSTRGLTVVLLFVLLSGCATTQTATQVNRLEWAKETPTILLMTPDIKYYLLTAGGTSEPQAEWTLAARDNFVDAVGSFAEGRGTAIQRVQESEIDATRIAYEKLHFAVGSTILNNHFGYYKLPGKAGAFDWSLGPDISALGDRYGADYALFSYYRDYQASGGRIAFAVLAAAAGVGVSTGFEGGFASLVDLRTGEVVWFNVVNAGVGELRNAQGAGKVVETLFRDLPQT